MVTVEWFDAITYRFLHFYFICLELSLDHCVTSKTESGKAKDECIQTQPRHADHDYLAAIGKGTACLVNSVFHY